MKVFILIVHCLLASVLIKAQGVKFDTNLNWRQIKEKARLENKYVFVDAFTTWCGPCKAMDSLVYTNGKVGFALNDKFISVRIQIDSTRKDNDYVKEWRKDAQDILQQYGINAFPSFLFFSPEGSLVHRDIGYKTVGDFISLIKDVTDVNKQYYSLLQKYNEGKMEFSSMPLFANTAKRLQYPDIANKVANNYVENYLLKLSDKELFTKKNIEFIEAFTNTSTDKGFMLFYNNSDKVDVAINRTGFAQGRLDYIIAKEEVDNRLWKNKDLNQPVSKKPDWNTITSIIRKEYNKAFAERIVLNAQIRWYNSIKDWRNIEKYSMMKLEKYGPDTVGIGKPLLNNMIWDVILLHSDDSKNLNKAISLMEILIKSEPNDQSFVDTYANLLFKVGRKKEAITWEEKAATMEEEAAIKNKRISDNSFRVTLEAMKKDNLTWQKD